MASRESVTGPAGTSAGGGTNAVHEVRFVARTSNGAPVASEPVHLRPETAPDPTVTSASWAHLECSPGYVATAAASVADGEGATVEFHVRRDGGSADEAVLSARVVSGVASCQWTVPDALPVGAKVGVVARCRGSEARAEPFSTVPRKWEQLRIDLEVDPEDPLTFDDQVTVYGSGGYHRQLGVASEGKLHAHVKGMTTLIFPGVKLGGRYTCTVNPGRQGKPYTLFKDLELTKAHVL